MTSLVAVASVVPVESTRLNVAPAMAAPVDVTTDPVMGSAIALTVGIEQAFTVEGFLGFSGYGQRLTSSS